MILSRFIPGLVAGLIAVAPSAVSAGSDPVEVSFLMCYRPNHPQDPATKAMKKFAKEAMAF